MPSKRRRRSSSGSYSYYYEYSGSDDESGSSDASKSTSSSRRRASRPRQRDSRRRRRRTAGGAGGAGRQRAKSGVSGRSRSGHRSGKKKKAASGTAGKAGTKKAKEKEGKEKPKKKTGIGSKTKKAEDGEKKKSRRKGTKRRSSKTASEKEDERERSGKRSQDAQRTEKEANNSASEGNADAVRNPLRKRRSGWDEMPSPVPPVTEPGILGTLPATAPNAPMDVPRPVGEAPSGQSLLSQMTQSFQGQSLLSQINVGGGPGQAAAVQAPSLVPSMPAHSQELGASPGQPPSGQHGQILASQVDMSAVNAAERAARTASLMPQVQIQQHKQQTSQQALHMQQLQPQTSLQAQVLPPPPPPPPLQQQQQQLQQQPQRPMVPPTRQFALEQRFVGYVIGQGGETLRHIRDVCGVIVEVDQSTKEQGYSTAQIFGSPEGADRAMTMIQARVAEIDPSQRADGEVEEIQVDQGLVGYLLGKGGETLKSIKSESGAAISLDQSTKEQGFSIVRIFGSSECMKAARSLVQAKMAEVKPAGHPGGHEFQVGQAFVGFLIGKGGETVKGIKEQTGATVVIDQATKELGYSIVRVLPGPGADAARQLLETKLREAEGGGSMTQEIPIEQQWVGWLIGRGGETVRHIKEHSGATMIINQNTKDHGFSTIRLTGSEDAIAKARVLVARKLEQLGCLRMPEPGPLIPSNGVGVTASLRPVGPPRAVTRQASAGSSVTPLPKASSPGGQEAYDPFAEFDKPGAVAAPAGQTTDFHGAHVGPHVPAENTAGASVSLDAMSAKDAPGVSPHASVSVSAADERSTISGSGTVEKAVSPQRAETGVIHEGDALKSQVYDPFAD